MIAAERKQKRSPHCRMSRNETNRASIYVTAKRFQDKQSQKCAKDARKRHKIAIITDSHFTYASWRHDALTQPRSYTLICRAATA